jgi:protein-S-isoprenylcysteine O-methyltransferase Ste14
MPAPFVSWFPTQATAISFLVVFFLWSAFELYNTLGTRRFLAPTAQRKDRGSYWIILLTVWGSLTVAFLLRVFDIGSFHGYLQYFGLAAMVLGIALREWSVFTLGWHFSTSVMTEPNQALVTHGPYRRLRHPSYSGTILMLIGVPLALGSWAVVPLILVFSLWGFSYRVRIEERALLESFGGEYRKYMEHTWRFLPGF